MRRLLGLYPLVNASSGSNGGYAVKGLVIGTSCTSIGSNAFHYCSALTGDLVIPDSVTSIGSMLLDCFGLTGFSIPDVLRIGVCF